MLHKKISGKSRLAKNVDILYNIQLWLYDYDYIIWQKLFQYTIYSEFWNSTENLYSIFNCNKIDPKTNFGKYDF